MCFRFFASCRYALLFSLLGVGILSPFVATLASECSPTKARRLLLRENYKIREMSSWMRASDLRNGAHHFSQHETAAARIYIRDGKLYDSNGKLFDTRDSILPFGRNTKEHFALFVMDEKGQLYALKNPKRTGSPGDEFHSSILDGAPVAGAGEIRVEDGIPFVINDNSGHYPFPPEFLEQIVAEMELNGLDLSRVEIQSFGGSKP